MKLVVKCFFLLLKSFILTSCIQLKAFVQDRNIVDLSRKGLIEIPKEILEDTTIQILKLYGNRLDSLPEGILKMTNLKTMNAPLKLKPKQLIPSYI